MTMLSIANLNLAGLDARLLTGRPSGVYSIGLDDEGATVVDRGAVAGATVVVIADEAADARAIAARSNLPLTTPWIDSGALTCN